jgi:hypothetical protein
MTAFGRCANRLAWWLKWLKWPQRTNQLVQSKGVSFVDAGIVDIAMVHSSYGYSPRGTSMKRYLKQKMEYAQKITGEWRLKVGGLAQPWIPLRT